MTESNDRKQTAYRISRQKRRLAELTSERSAVASRGQEVYVKEWQRHPSQKPRRTKAVLFGNVTGANGVLSDPALSFSYYLRRMLQPRYGRYVVSPCRVIDPKTGRVVATIDPVTRVRTEVPE